MSPRKDIRLSSLIGANQYRIRLPTNWFPCNPSIARDGENFLMIVRTLNYELGAGGGGPNIPLDQIQSLNWLVRLNGNLHVTEATKIEDQNIRANDRAARGLEDARLFRWRGDWWYAAAGLASGPPRTTMTLCRLQGTETVEAKFIPSPLQAPLEKNWMPLVDREELTLIYRISPASVMRRSEDGEFGFHTLDLANAAFNGWSGSSQCIPYGKHWLCVVHRRIFQEGLPIYQHAFLELDRSLQIVNFSAPWYFDEPTIEFCAGLCATQQYAVLSYGHLDREARLLKVPLFVVEKLLKKDLLSKASTFFKEMAYRLRHNTYALMLLS